MLVNVVRVGCGEVVHEQAGLVVVTDSLGTPLCVAHEIRPGVHTVSKAGDRDFAQTLYALGLDRLKFVGATQLQLKPRDELPSLILPR